MKKKIFEREIESRLNDPQWSARILKTLEKRQGIRMQLKRVANSNLGFGLPLGALAMNVWIFFMGTGASWSRQSFIAEQVNGIYSIVFPEEEQENRVDLAYGKEALRDEVDDLIVSTLKKR